MPTVSSPQPFTIRIFAAEGEPAGIRTVEKSNWSGRGLIFPRQGFSKAVKRGEMNKAGIYVLVGESAISGRNQIYIGEGDAVRDRLTQHFKEKDFWSVAYVFVSKDDNLNKAHVQFLEARLWELASQAKRCDLENKNQPQRPSLSEGDELGDVDGFLREMLLCLPILGLDAFQIPTKSAEVRQHGLSASGKGASAKGYETPEGFVIEAGSTAAISEAPTTPGYVSALRRQLLESGVLNQRGELYLFTQPYTFTSPSTAAAVVLARNANGRREWKDDQGRMLREIQESMS